MTRLKITRRLGSCCLLLWLLVAACGSEETTTQPAATVTEVPKKVVKIPVFNRDSAYQYIAKQVSFGPRVMNTEAHERNLEWMVRKLEAFGAEVSRQEFVARAYTGEDLRGTNVIARYEPNATDRILLCAHWDSRHIADSEKNTGRTDVAVDGADDGASGVGVLLEIARHLGEVPPGIGVDIVMLDAEDYGESGADNPESWGLGAQYYSRNLPGGVKPRYGILLDMVGAKNARFTVEEVSEYFAPEIRQKIWRLAKRMGYGNYFVEDESRAVTDDHFFINRIAQIPTIDIINRPTATTFVDHWHTDRDNMDNIDKRTLRAVGQVVLATVYREAAGSLR
ncbi:glutamine cyclotransferase [Lewinellaceae bacterium SD302]|nr:glutamine cyclotransferase [Lewinellaceae bacterium SD302]